MRTIDERRMPLWHGIRNLLLALVRLLPSPGLWVSVVLSVIVARAAGGYTEGLTPLTLVVDGVSQRIRTRCTTVGDVLDDVGVTVYDWDRVTPGRHVALQPKMQVMVQHAHPVTFIADGTTRTLHTHEKTIDTILDQADVDLRPGDQLWVNGSLVLDGLQPADPNSTAADPPEDPKVVPARLARTNVGRDPDAPAPISHVEVRRATTIHVYDGGVEQTLRTTARTLGQAFAKARILLYLSDHVYPDLNTPVSTGMRVRIVRGVPVSVLVDGRTIRTRTHRETVGEVLAELGVSLMGRDFAVPQGDQAVHAGVEVKVSRVTEALTVEETEIPFETEWTPDSSLELDRRRVDAVGANGIQRRRYRVVYQDGIEIERRLEDEWIEREPQSYKIAYGTKITIRTLDTPDGTIEYWRRIPVFLTAYTEATCGKEPDDPWYGLTRLGWKMRHGIVAVDPRVINMLSEVYVSGYGRGVAADTGGLIIGRHVDLGHDVDNYIHWFEWGYVYILTPSPPSSQIRWILPDFPRGRWP